VKELSSACDGFYGMILRSHTKLKNLVLSCLLAGGMIMTSPVFGLIEAAILSGFQKPHAPERDVVFKKVNGSTAFKSS
jgi:hypothetical protein